MTSLTPQPVDVKLYFNFRSPYCYLASKTMFGVFDDFYTHLVWKPLAGWSGRSAPDRAKVKVPLTRQDVSRWCRKLGVPFNPPPITTDPTAAGAGSFLADQQGLLKPYIIEMMRAEWGCGLDIGQPDVILRVGEEVGLDRFALEAAIEDPVNLQHLERNWEEAQTVGVIGVPTFVIGDQIFWGNDRLEFVRDHLRELGLRKP